MGNAPEIRRIHRGLYSFFFSNVVSGALSKSTFLVGWFAGRVQRFGAAQRRHASTTLEVFSLKVHRNFGPNCHGLQYMYIYMYIYILCIHLYLYVYLSIYILHTAYMILTIRIATKHKSWDPQWLRNIARGLPDQIHHVWLGDRARSRTS